MITHPIPPLYDENARILILGSFPSVKSREAAFFYGHPQNRFWRVTAAVFGEDPPRSIPEKKAFLLRNHIALWDVIGACEITGSSDASIRNVTPNDLRVILDAAPIRQIFVNGRTAEKYYKKYIEPRLGREAVCLPSTSPANAAWSEKRLTEAWQCVREAAERKEEQKDRTGTLSGQDKQNDMKIYFDMDGVLADFERGLRELCGMEPLKQEETTPEHDDILWAAVRGVPHFYDRLEPVPGAVELLAKLYEKHGDDCQILTAVPKQHRGISDAAADKRAWAERLLPPGVKVNIVYRKDKPDFGGLPNHFLIDDYSKNIREWEKGGGTGILFTDAASAEEAIRGLGLLD